MKRKTARLLMLLLLCFSVSVVSAQQRRVTGSVKDENGAPVAGASVVEKGTANGVMSDDNGAFAITVQNQNAVLVISSVNFTTREVEVGQESNVPVVLESTGTLQGVVVTALGISKRQRS